MKHLNQKSVSVGKRVKRALRFRLQFVESSYPSFTSGREPSSFYVNDCTARALSPLCCLAGTVPSTLGLSKDPKKKGLS